MGHGPNQGRLEMGLSDEEKANGWAASPTLLGLIRAELAGGRILRQLVGGPDPDHA